MKLSVGILLAALLLTCLSVPGATAQDKPAIPEPDRIRLAEAFRLADALGERLWLGWNRAPFAVLLVTPKHEFLIRHPRPGEDFMLLGEDKLLSGEVYFRKRVFEPHLVATLPAIGGISTIVIGQAENTAAKTSTPWVLSALHEHFHQLQDSQPNAYAEYESLGLARGDTTGMWMLNFPFPYEQAEVKETFSSLTQTLGRALANPQATDFQDKVTAYRNARVRLRQQLSEDDYRYFSFQLWKEGVARYTELRMAQLAAAEYEPSPVFRALPDYTHFVKEAEDMLRGILGALTAPRLSQRKRVAFYALGAAEALLLDRVNPLWREIYFREKFFPERYFQR